MYVHFIRLLYKQQSKYHPPRHCWNPQKIWVPLSDPKPFTPPVSNNYPNLKK